jgi:hypothetical protein
VGCGGAGDKGSAQQQQRGGRRQQRARVRRAVRTADMRAHAPLGRQRAPPGQGERLVSLSRFPTACSA